jgi:hypothetical protein
MLLGAYPLVYVVVGSVGHYLLRTMKARWPHMGTATPLVILFAAYIVFFIPLEAFFWMRLRYYDEAVQPSVFPSYWAHDPLLNVIGVAVTITLLSLLSTRNDRGETIVERGVAMDSSPKPVALRFLAVFGAVQILTLGCYHIPMVITTLLQPPAHWSSDLTDNSFMNDHICGYGTPRACP